MTPSEFNHLPKDQQILLFQKQGRYIGERFYKGMKLLFYKIQDFYVQVLFDPQKNAFKSFTAVEQLEPLEEAPAEKSIAKD
jgi:hypothetical protein